MGRAVGSVGGLPGLHRRMVRVRPTPRRRTGRPGAGHGGAGTRVGRADPGGQAPRQFPRLPGRRLHRHAGQWRPALPSRTVGELRRPGHHRHRRHRLQLRPAVRADAPVHREIGHCRMRVRNPHRPTRRPLHRLPGLQHPARGRRFRGPRRLHGLHTRHQPLLGSGRRGHPAAHLHAGRPGHRPHRLLQHGGRILRAAAHRIAHRRRYARPGRRHRVPQRLHRRLRLACRPSARLRRPEP